MSPMLLVISVNARNECTLEEIPHQKLDIIKSTKLFYNCPQFFFKCINSILCATKHGNTLPVTKNIPFRLEFFKNSAAICSSDNTSTRKMTNIECSKIFALDVVFVKSGQNFARGADCTRILEELRYNSKAVQIRSKNYWRRKLRLWSSSKEIES